MVTARLIDNIWATRKAEALNGSKLMLAGGDRGNPGPGNGWWWWIPSAPELATG